MTAEELNDLPFVMPPAGSFHENEMLVMLAVHGIRPSNIIGRTQYFDVMSEMFEAGTCVGVTIEPLLKPEQREATVMLHRLDDWRITLYRNPKPRHAQHAIVEQFLTSAILDDPAYPLFRERGQAMPAAPFTLRQLEVFGLLCELRSFRQVGEQLGISQASVSNQLKALEQQLGVRLLMRESGRRPQLTPEGALFPADLGEFWDACAGSPSPQGRRFDRRRGAAAYQGADRELSAQGLRPAQARVFRGLSRHPAQFRAAFDQRVAARHDRPRPLRSRVVPEPLQHPLERWF